MVNLLAMLRLQSHQLDRPLEAPEDSPPTHLWDDVLVRLNKKATSSNLTEEIKPGCAFVR